MLAEDDEQMVALLKNHLYDVQNTGPTKMPWKFRGAWEIYGKTMRSERSEFQILIQN